jgi:hypothetical protein
MPKNAAVFVIVASIVIIAGIAFFAWSFQQHTKRLLTEDAVFVIATQVHDAIREKPELTDDEILAVVRRLQETGAIDIVMGPGGRPMDPYGGPLAIRHEFRGGALTVSCASAGPDRIDGTPDDIRHDYESLADPVGKPREQGAPPAGSGAKAREEVPVRPDR